MKPQRALSATWKLLLVPLLACLAAGCDLTKPEPPIKDPPRDQRIKSQEPRKSRVILVSVPVSQVRLSRV